MSRPRLLALLLALLTLLVYLPVARNGFIIYDDNDYVAENQMVQAGWTAAGFKWAFTTFTAANWHPLTWLSHMTDCELFGLNPAPMHLINAIFHAANTALLFLLLFRLTAKLWPCAFAAALFALHPAHVESVAWISERKDVLSTLFGFLALLCYVSYAKEKSRRNYWLSFLFFGFSLMAKPMLVTMPCVMLLLDFWPLGRFAGYRLQVESSGRSKPATSNLPLVIEKLPFFLLTAASCVITFIAQNRGAVVSLKDLPLDYRLESSVVAFAMYLGKLFWPMHLAVIYPMPDSIPVLAAVISALVLAGLTVAVWLARKDHSYLLMGWLWFLGTLVPVIGLVKVGDAAMADRYTYIPSIGIFIAVALGWESISKRFHLPKAVLLVAAVLILGTLTGLTGRQIRFWRDDESLFGHALKVTKYNFNSHINYGVALEREGRLEEALAQYQEAARLVPGSVHVHQNIGNILDSLGRREEAIAEYRKVLAIDPSSPRLHDAYGGVLVEMGNYADGMTEFSNAARLDPSYPWPYYQMAKALLAQGKDAEAIERLQTALKLEPNNFQILAFTAHVLAADENPALRDGKTALEYAAKANVISDNSAPFVLDALAMACAETGDFTNAIAIQEHLVSATNADKIKDIDAMRKRLELYKNHQPWRESFLATTNASIKE